MKTLHMKTFAAAGLALGLAAACQQASQTSSDLRPAAEIMATDGLAKADAALSARQQTPQTAFELGGVRFLRAFEAMLQVQYETLDGTVPFLPGLRTPLPANPKLKFDPAFVERALKGALVHLAAAETALAPATSGDFSASLPLDAIWLDVDRDGKRSEWESLKAMLEGLGAQADWSQFGGTIRFDSADAEWLAAYVHLISGVSEMVIAVDPTSAIRTVTEGRQRLVDAGANVGVASMFLGNETLDQVAAALLALEGKPDVTRTRAALDHFSKMIAHNRKFWPKLLAETDNELEWLPNPSQTSPFGIQITAEIAQTWQDVLADIDDILAGRQLIPYGGGYDAPSPVGINVKRMLTDPPDMNLILLIQGASIAPYLEKGKLANMEAWQRFETLLQGDGLLMAVLLN